MRNLVLLEVVLATSLTAHAQPTWIEHQIGTAYRIYDFQAIDMDGDGNNEVFQRTLYGAGWWEYMDDEWAYTNIVNGAEDYDAIKPGDLDNDGDTDLVTIRFNDDDFKHHMKWWENIAGNFTVHMISDTLFIDDHLQVIDLDGDNDLDLCTYSYYWLGGDYHYFLSMWLNNGDADLWDLNRYPPEFLGTPSNLQVTDIDLDGDIDVLGVSYEWYETLSELFVYRQDQVNTLNFTYHLIASGADEFDGKRVLFGYKLDRNRRPDIICNGRDQVNDRSVTFAFEPRPEGWRVRALDDPPFEMTGVLAPADMDGDGDRDLLANHSHQLGWYIKHLDQYSWYPVHPDIQRPKPVDFDGDGDLDLLYEANGYDQDTLYWYEQISDDGNWVDLFSPTGEDEWLPGSSRRIAWGTNASAIPVRLTLYDDVDSVLTISELTPNDGEHIVEVPLDILPSTDYSIYVELIDGSGGDFNHDPFTILSVPIVTLIPVDPPIIIPETGGVFWYWLTIDHSNDYPDYYGEIWTRFTLPDGSLTGPVERVRFSPVFPIEFDEPFTQWVPLEAEAGEYEFIVQLGKEYPNVISEDRFAFTKLGTLTTGEMIDSSGFDAEQWYNTLDEKPTRQFTVHPQSNPNLPTTVNLGDPYPNPFNATTKITLSLPSTEFVSMGVYNIQGRFVQQTFVEHPFPAGYHTLTIDGANWPSGLYFILVKAGSYSNTRKIVLMK